MNWQKTLQYSWFACFSYLKYLYTRKEWRRRYACSFRPEGACDGYLILDIIVTLITISCCWGEKPWEIICRAWAPALSLLSQQTDLLIISSWHATDTFSFLLPEHWNISLPGTEDPLSDIPHPVVNCSFPHFQLETLLNNTLFGSLYTNRSDVTIPPLTRLMVFLCSRATCTSRTSHSATLPRSWVAPLEQKS